MKTVKTIAACLGDRVHRAKLPAIGKGVVLSLAVAMGPAAADDTEVFFGQVDPTADIHPNVLFVLDTSGSMNWGDDGQDGSRLERLKTAMTTIIDSSTNLNIGLMRFNGYGGGGSVIYPVRGVDEEVCATADCGDINVARRVMEQEDNAEEKVVAENVLTNGYILSMSHEGNDSNKQQHVGVRFRDLMIPQGAQITSAKVVFTAQNSDDSDAGSLTIHGEAADDAAVFAQMNKNISNRSLTTASEPWVPEAWNRNETYSSPDISSVIQEIVDRSQWCGGNALALVIKGNAYRNAMSRRNGADIAPLLRVSYDGSGIPANGGCIERVATSQISGPSEDTQERVSNGKALNFKTNFDIPYRLNRPAAKFISGLRFKNLGIARDTEIVSATLELTVDRGRPGTSVVNIDIENSGDSAAFDGSRQDLSGRSKVGNAVPWALPGNSPEGQRLYSDDLGALVQAVVNRADWSDDSAMSFFLSPNSATGSQRYKNYESEATSAPKLRVVYRSKGATNSDGAKIQVRDQLKEAINNLKATGGTPIVSAFHEAAEYMLGGDVDYGRSRGTDDYNGNDQRHRYHRVSDPLSYTLGSGGSVIRENQCTDNDPDSNYCRKETISGAATYDSPLGNTCQSNHIVFLSDGAPTSNTAASKVRATTGVSDCSVNWGYEACGVEMGTWLSETDHIPNIKGTQGITTHTIGFNQNSDFLQAIAIAGGGKYSEAASASDLVSTFESILAEVAAVDTSFVAPGATVNQFNRLTHRSDIYFALFQPNKRPTWSGNLKRYEVRPQASGPDGEVEIQIQGQDGSDAIDVETGFFAADSWSLWSGARDGSSVAAGGAAAEMSLDNQHGTGARRVFTFTGEDSDLTSTATVDLTHSDHALHEDNPNIDFTDLGIENRPGDKAAYKQELLKWARGVDVDDEDQDGEIDDIRNQMGDPMHSRPVILNYAKSGGSDTTIFVSTNEGFLHAIDRGGDAGNAHTNGGTELFSFIPRELLSNLDPYFENQADTSHPYGLDGALSVWTQDDNNNVMIDGDEKAFIYVGMRRGGNNYYALDVTDRLKPKLAWVIKGGPDGTPGFEELGQSWSRMVPATIQLNSEKKDVLIFSGGYDVNQDPVRGEPNRVSPVDSSGRAIYMVDAETGALVYSFGGPGVISDKEFPQMMHSIPGNIRVVDIDFDGLVDQLYVGDMGAQLWRFDIAKYHESGDFISGGVMAKLDGAGIVNDRRFYSEPDVAVISRDGERFLSIGMGSGWRAHPLNEFVNDRFYMIRSNNVYSAPEKYGKTVAGVVTDLPITEADLVNVTSDVDADIEGYSGWMLELEETGEKVLGPSITINNQLIFTSYRPDPAVEDCSTAVGDGAVYAVSVFNGGPTLDLTEDGSKTKDDRLKVLAHGGIPPDPAALITSSADGSIIKPTILVGPEQPLDVDFNNLTQRSFWMDKEKKEVRAIVVSEDDAE